MLFCSVLSVFYYPILEVKNPLISVNVFSSKLQTGETVNKEKVLLNTTNIVPKLFSQTFLISFSPSCLFIILHSNFESTDPSSILLCQHESILKGPCHDHAICYLFTKLKLVFTATKFQNNDPVLLLKTIFTH